LDSGVQKIFSQIQWAMKPVRRTTSYVCPDLASDAAAFNCLAVLISFAARISTVYCNIPPANLALKHQEAAAAAGGCVFVSI
jgi:hypothetical protein